MLGALAILFGCVLFVTYAHAKRTDRAPVPPIPSKDNSLVGSLFALVFAVGFVTFLLVVLVAFIHFAWRLS